MLWQVIKTAFKVNIDKTINVWMLTSIEEINLLIISANTKTIFQFGGCSYPTMWSVQGQVYEITLLTTAKCIKLCYDRGSNMLLETQQWIKLWLSIQSQSSIQKFTLGSWIESKKIREWQYWLPAEYQNICCYSDYNCLLVLTSSKASVVMAHLSVYRWSVKQIVVSLILL